MPHELVRNELEIVGSRANTKQELQEAMDLGVRGHRAGNQPWPSRTPRTAKAMASTSMAMAMSATCSS